MERLEQSASPPKSAARSPKQRPAHVGQDKLSPPTHSVNSGKFSLNSSGFTRVSTADGGLPEGEADGIAFCCIGGSENGIPANASSIACIMFFASSGERQLAAHSPHITCQSRSPEITRLVAAYLIHSW